MLCIIHQLTAAILNVTQANIEMLKVDINGPITNLIKKRIKVLENILISVRIIDFENLKNCRCWKDIDSVQKVNSLVVTDLNELKVCGTG